MLPGGVQSLVTALQRNSQCLVELKSNGFYIRLKGSGVEGMQFYRCVWDSAVAEGLVPVTVRSFDFSDNEQFAAYVAALQEGSLYATSI